MSEGVPSPDPRGGILGLRSVNSGLFADNKCSGNAISGPSLTGLARPRAVDKPPRDLKTEPSNVPVTLHLKEAPSGPLVMPKNPDSPGSSAPGIVPLGSIPASLFADPDASPWSQQRSPSRFHRASERASGAAPLEPPSASGREHRAPRSPRRHRTTNDGATWRSLPAPPVPADGTGTSSDEAGASAPPTAAPFAANLGSRVHSAAPAAHGGPSASAGSGPRSFSRIPDSEERDVFPVDVGLTPWRDSKVGESKKEGAERAGSSTRGLDPSSVREPSGIIKAGQVELDTYGDLGGLGRGGVWRKCWAGIVGMGSDSLVHGISFKIDTNTRAAFVGLLLAIAQAIGLYRRAFDSMCAIGDWETGQVDAFCNRTVATAYVALQAALLAALLAGSLYGLAGRADPTVWVPRAAVSLFLFRCMAAVFGAFGGHKCISDDHRLELFGQVVSWGEEGTRVVLQVANEISVPGVLVMTATKLTIYEPLWMYGTNLLALFGTFIAACECRALTERRATGIAFAASDHAIFIVSASCAVLLALALSYFVNMGQLWGGHAMHKGAHLSLFLTWGLLASVCVFGILFLPSSKGLSVPGWAFVVLGVLIAGTVRASNIAGMAARDRLLNEIMPPDVAAEMLWHVIAPEHTSPAYGQLSMLSSPHLESTIGNRTHHASRIKPARPTRSAIAGANRTNRSTIVPDAANGNEKGDDLKGKGSGGDGDGDRNGGRDRVEGPSTTEKIRSEHVKFGGSFAQGLSRHGNAMSFGSPDKAFVKGKDDVFIVHTGFDMAGLPDDNSAMDDFIDALHRAHAAIDDLLDKRQASKHETGAESYTALIEMDTLGHAVVNAVGLAQDIVDAVSSVKGAGDALRVRVAVHVGTVALARLGRRMPLLKLLGRPVQIVRNILAHVPPGAVRVSKEVFRALPPALRVTFPSCATVVLPLVGRTTVHGPKGVSDRFTASVEVPATQLSMGARMSAFAQDSPATRVLTHAGNDSMTRFKKFSSTGRRTTMGAGGNSLQR